MEAASKIAIEKGLLVGAVFWNITNQDQFADLDFAQYFDETHLNRRQELMARHVELDVYSSPGVGTALEFYNTMTNQKIGIGGRKPQFLLGEADVLLDQIKNQVEKGFTPPELLKNIYIIKDGSEVYNLLGSHFNLST